MIRVAVVGPIKSGKSTFINSMIGKDYLKRGAGVVTSIVTRIGHGRDLCARLFFKSWDDINQEINKAASLLPVQVNKATQPDYDIRREPDREALTDLLQGLDKDQLIVNDSRNADSLLISAYLDGFAKLKPYIDSESNTKEFKHDGFLKHQQFVGNDASAVYLKDVQLTAEMALTMHDVEIADCQGSDSPNPLHLAMIQNYLVRTHLLVYVISSRTGLRQADVRFLSMIKRMGILDNSLFVVNCDCSEHESLEELQRLVEKVVFEVGLIKKDPEIFVVSALFDLFSAEEAKLNAKDRLRLDQWRADQAIVDYLVDQRTAFESVLKSKLSDERNALLVGNHLKRLAIIASGIDHWIDLNLKLYSRDRTSAESILSKITEHQGRMENIQSIIKRTMDGAEQKLIPELKSEVDRFFDWRYGSLMKGIRGFIRSYSPTLPDADDDILKAGFGNSLLLTFQEFKHALDVFMTREVNPQIIQFIHGQEQVIKEYLETVGAPYETMVRDALLDYLKSLGPFGIKPFEHGMETIALPGMEVVRQNAGLAMPPAEAALNYSTKIRSEAVLRYSLYRTSNFIRRFFKRKTDTAKNFSEGQRALQDGLNRIKQETEKAIQFYFKDYRENLKFKYMLNLVKAAAGHLYLLLVDRLKAYNTDLDQHAKLINQAHKGKSEAQQYLNTLSAEIKALSKRIEMIDAHLEFATPESAVQSNAAPTPNAAVARLSQ
jgi:hypothetical protein